MLFTNIFLHLVCLYREYSVCEHEIVAVLPKRSGSEDHINVMVTTDSDSEPEDSSTEADSVHHADREDIMEPRIKYFVTRNPRNDSPLGRDQTLVRLRLKY